MTPPHILVTDFRYTLLMEPFVRQRVRSHLRYAAGTARCGLTGRSASPRGVESASSQSAKVEFPVERFLKCP